MSRAYLPVHIKSTVIERAHGRCEYCQCRADYTTDYFHVEHIIPVSRGGTDELDNLALACSRCNGHKYIKGAVNLRTVLYAIGKHPPQSQKGNNP